MATLTMTLNSTSKQHRIRSSPSNSSASAELGLLKHLPQYGVVVCRQCRFAVQPSALSSHLQNHGILRSERRRILDQLSQLHLLNPDQVPVPASNDPPLPDLPVLNGYKCRALLCNYTCTSSKRMSQHWSEIHQQPNSRLVSQRAAKLQTFFRGNKIRYFEVSGPADSPCWTQKQSQRARDSIRGPGSASNELLSEDASTPASLQPSNAETVQQDDAADADAPQLDFQALRYWHHFMSSTVTALTRGDDSLNFWHRTVSLEAFRHPFLMYAMLAMAAVEESVTASTRDEAARHRRAFTAYQAGSLPGFRAAVASPSEENSTAIIACARLTGIQDAAQDLLDLDAGKGEITLSALVEHTTLLRGCSDLLLDLQPVLPADSGFKLHDSAARRRAAVYEDALSAGAEVPHILAMSPGVPHHVYATLATLEERLASLALFTANERPVVHAAVRDLAAAVAASWPDAADADALAEYDSDNEDGLAMVWSGVDGWLHARSVRDGLMPLLSARRPAALVLMGVWAVLLLRRVICRHRLTARLTAWIVRAVSELSGCMLAEDVLRGCCEAEGMRSDGIALDVEW